MNSRDEVAFRAGNCCEAFVQNYVGVIHRCWRYPIEVHHMLTRARGGGILDAVGETYHLIALCNECHSASDGSAAYEEGVLIEGYVTWNADKTWPSYDGPDEYLSNKYPRSNP